MDTIQISITLRKEKMQGIAYEKLLEVREYITELYCHKKEGILKNGNRGEIQLRYCDCLELSKKGRFIIKISYPRFYKGINAFIIENSAQCMEVQAHFCLALKKHELLCDALISLDRVDIPFTFLMDPEYNFISYKKVYQVLSFVHERKNKNGSVKAYTDAKKFSPQTVIFADTKSISSFNKKITIYNQYKNIEEKTKDEELFQLICMEHGDLRNRMRIEVSKRIRRKGLTIQEFGEFNILKEYIERYKKYLLEKLFDLEEIEKIYDDKATELAKVFLSYRDNSNKVNYMSFIYKEIDKIYDYEIIRRALKICIKNENTKENAITVIRKILNSYQANEKIIVMDTYKIIKDIRGKIYWSFMYPERTNF